MNDDSELEHWRSLWRADSEVPADLRMMAKKQLQRTRLMLYADIGVSALIGGAVIAWYLVNGEPAVRLLAIWVWVTLAAAWLFRWLHPGNWSGAAPNTEVFLEKLRGSYQAGLRNLKFGWVLGVMQLIFSSVWVYRQLREKMPLTIWQFVTLKLSLVVWACVGCLFASTVWLFLKLQRQLRIVRQLQSEGNSFDSEVAEISKPRESLAARLMSQLIEGLALFPSRFDELDWEIRRKKKNIRRV